MHVCMHAANPYSYHICTCACTELLLCIHTHLFMHQAIFLFIIRFAAPQRGDNSNIYTLMHTYIHTHTHAYMQARIQACTLTHINTPARMHTLTHSHTYTHTSHHTCTPALFSNLTLSVFFFFSEFMQKHNVSIHASGRCLNNVNAFNMYPHCMLSVNPRGNKLCLQTHYRFTLAFENVIETDYVTVWMCVCICVCVCVVCGQSV